MRFIFYILPFVLLLGCEEAPKTTIEEVSPEEMKSLLELDNVQLIDVRTSSEFAMGYIEGAQNIDFLSDTFNQDIKRLDKTKPVIVYCQKGGRSAKCAEKMKLLGFTKIYDLEGGFSRWKHEGFIEK